MTKPTCPRCGRPGGVQMLTTVAPCDECVAAEKAAANAGGIGAYHTPQAVMGMIAALAGRANFCDSGHIVGVPTDYPFVDGIHGDAAAFSAAYKSLAGRDDPTIGYIRSVVESPVVAADQWAKPVNLADAIQRARDTFNAQPYSHFPHTVTLDPDRDFPGGVLSDHAFGANEVIVELFPTIHDAAERPTQAGSPEGSDPSRLRVGVAKDFRPDSDKVGRVIAALHDAGYAAISVETTRLTYAYTFCFKTTVLARDLRPWPKVRG